MPDLNAVPASKLLDFSRSRKRPHSLVNAMGEYQAMMDAIREGVVNKTPATAPSDLVERSKPPESIRVFSGHLDGWHV